MAVAHSRFGAPSHRGKNLGRIGISSNRDPQPRARYRTVKILQLSKKLSRAGTCDPLQNPQPAGFRAFVPDRFAFEDERALFFQQ